MSPLPGTRAVCLRVTIVFCAVLMSYVTSREVERHPNDGWFNNLIHPDWGAIDSQMLRRSPTNYSDGVYQPSGSNRPNPLDISRISFSGLNNLSSVRKRNTLLVFFGQQLVEEILDAQRPGCPIEFFNIPVPKGHKYNPDNKDNLEMPFQRARFDQNTGHSANNPRQQINEITPYIDGSLVYSASKATEDALREFSGGRLAANSSVIEDSFPIINDIRLPLANPPPPRDHVLRPVNRFRRYGNPRTHENPFMLTLATIWFRYHNFIANQLKVKDPSLDDEELFFAAKKRVIGQYQKIVMYEWLPHWLQITENGTTFDIRGQYPYKGGMSNKYAGYDPNVHPGISTEFQAAAMRFGHTLIPAGVVTKSVQNGKCTITWRDVKAKFTNANGTDSESNVKVKGLRLCNTFWVPQEALEHDPGIDSIIRGLITTRTAKEDNIIVTDIRENVFGPLEWSRRDLGALNIQRGRDEGLPSYNDIREAYGLPRHQSWTDINPEYPDILKQLQQLYGNTSAPDNLDLFPGGMLETTFDGPGPLFRAILLDQFLRIRHGDRFWYENDKNGLYTPEEVKEIEATMFYDVINNVTNALRDPKILNVTREEVFFCSNSTDSNGCECNDPVVDDEPTHEVCAPLQHYDYFTGSEVSFVLTIIGIVLSIPVTIGIMMCMSLQRRNQLNVEGKRPAPKLESSPNHFYATEWVGRSSHGFLSSRDVKINLDDTRLKILVASMKGQVIRMIDLRRKQSDQQHTPRASVTRSSDKGHKLLMVGVPGEIDLVLHFPTQNDRDSAFNQLQGFFRRHTWDFHEGPNMAENVMWREATTVDQRKELLAKFFKSVLAEMSGDETAQSSGNKLEDVLATKLTRTEFADALGLQPQSLFVRNMFLLVDSSGDGFVSFDEFKAYFGILSSGKPEQKAEMFFKMFDTRRTGKLSKEDYKKMIIVLFEMNEADKSKINMDSMVDAVFKQVGKSSNDFLTLQDFKKIMFSDTADLWKSAVLNLEVDGETTTLGYKQSVRGRAKSFINGYTKNTRPTSLVSYYGTSVKLPSKVESAPKTKFTKFMHKWTRYIDNHRRQIFWVTLYTLIVIGIFTERAYYYSVEREHNGLRRLAGYGVSVTRGAASVQMFAYASLLVTMCRNTLTFFRETFLHHFIPFDNFHDMHIYIAFIAVLFSVMHVIGHVINFYHICTQSSDDLNCYFREYFRATDVLASFHYWTYQTITGLTGIALILVLVVMYVFAMPYARRHVFKYFRSTHNLYIAVYILIFLHGHHRLVQEPIWPWYFIGPVVLFVLDKLVSVSRNKVLLPVHKATLLPSDVIHLVFKRPLTFDYHSGQWVRIACPKLGKGEYHPFTLTSSPHEENLSLHIRAVGPWTTNLRSLFDPNALRSSPYPKIYLDGPFGESHQDWYRYSVSVLVGGGIGVTPFASILKDIASRAVNVSRLPVQKVYFLWVTRTQQSFEWMTDIIRQVEAADIKNFVDVQICITQIKEQYDLRTTMLYICERHFQKIAGVSMFTGLRAKTHFGRPNFEAFFQALKVIHKNVDQIGVFSCGPPAMTNSVQKACTEHNSFTGPSLIHYYENF